MPIIVPAAAGDRRVRGVEGPAGRLQGGEFRQGMGVPPGRQRQGGVGGGELGAPGMRQAHRVTVTVPNRVARAGRARSPGGSG